MKKEVIEAINTLKVFLGMEKQEEKVVKLAEQMKLDNGTIIEVDAFEVGAAVAIVNEEERIPLPAGEYKLEDGRILVCTEDGVLAEIKDAIETPEQEQVEEEAPMMSEEPAKEIKKVVESTVKETFFAEIEKLKAENEELKAKLTELSKVEVKEEVKEVELSEEPKPITHNPENKVEKEIVKFGKGKDRISTILEKIYN